MFNLFDLNIIPTFLSRFKVNKVLAIGLSNKEIINIIIDYCSENDVLLTAIDSNINISEFENKENKEFLETINYHKDNSLNILPTFKSFDAVFINGDPNWYTLYNELNLIKKTNSSFPLVFICNNKYPHKRRDSYLNPEDIPEEFKNECCNELPVNYEDNGEIKQTLIKDGFCHAILDNTPKNGVLTAIEDFLEENKSLKIMEINPLEGISLIYKPSNIINIRINKILEEKKESEYTPGDLSDKFIENKLLLSHVTGINLLKEDIDRVEEFKEELEEKTSQIKDYKNTIQLHNTQIKYKDSLITNVESQISLKDTQIQNIEAKLFNRENELNAKDKKLSSKEDELKLTYDKLNNLENSLLDNKKELQSTKKEIEDTKYELNNSKIIENKYRKIIESNNEEITNSKNQLEIAKEEIVNISTQINNKDSEIQSKNNEINNLKNQLNQKDIQIQTKESELNSKNKELELTKEEIVNISTQINNKDSEIQSKNNEINNLKNQINKNESKFKSQLQTKDNELKDKENQLKISESQLDSKNIRFKNLKNKYDNQLNKINRKDYSINRYEEKLEHSNIEIDYLKKSDKLTKKILIPIAYACLIGKSKPSEISTNIKLYKALKSSECFDIGYYLKKYPDIPKSKWCKYFSPELHYVCNGFDEKRKFNKKYFNKKSRKELLKEVKTK